MKVKARLFPVLQKGTDISSYFEQEVGWNQLEMLEFSLINCWHFLYTRHNIIIWFGYIKLQIKLYTQSKFVETHVFLRNTTFLHVPTKIFLFVCLPYLQNFVMCCLCVTRLRPSFNNQSFLWNKVIKEELAKISIYLDHAIFIIGKRK